MNPSIQRKTTPSLLITLALLFVCSGVLPKVQAVVPPPEGGYPNFTTAAGDHALQALTLGVGNTAIGTFSLFSVTTGNFNTAVGAGSLDLNTADSNTATGAAALLFNTTGTENTANGTAALEFNETGSDNTAIGAFALFSQTEGIRNTAVGKRALFNYTTGGNNTAVGNDALLNNTTGNGNTALGYGAGNNITGGGNVCIGAGVLGEAGEDGRTYIRNVNTTAQFISAGVNDYVTVRLTDGRLGHTAVVSSQRYKQDIKPLAATSQALYALKPVSFRLKKEFDPMQALGFGLIAEEVEKVDPALVYRNAKGQVESVRYEMVNAMLLNEFLKEHRTVEKLKSNVAKQEATVAQQQKDFQATASRQQKEIEALTATVKEQAAQIQKASDQLELSRPAPQTVLNNH